MKYNKTFRSLAAFVLALMLMLTMGTLSVFAESEPDPTPSDTLEVDDLSGSDDGAAAPDSGETETESDDKSDDTASDKDDKEGLGVGFWVSMGILGVLIIVGVVFAIIKREKLKVWLKSYKSEIKKIVWMPWGQVRKNTVVVVVVVVAVAAVIGLLDFAFSKGIIALGNLF